MTQYYLLAALHHLAVFSLFGLVFAELALTQQGLTASLIRRIGKIDAAYGLLAGAVLAVGFLRVYYGPKGADFYWSNPFFHAKLTAFILAGLLSILPTVRFIQWRRALARDERALPPPEAVLAVRRWLLAEALALALVPVFAAGLGLGLGA